MLLLPHRRERTAHDRIGRPQRQRKQQSDARSHPKSSHIASRPVWTAPNAMKFSAGIMAAWPATPPFNLHRWIEQNRDLLKPPVGNKLLFEDSGFIIMAVGGPNSRKDYHHDPSEEFFFQIEGNMVLKTVQDGRLVDVPIREGEMYLLPAEVPHSPQRPAGSVGLVVERRRSPQRIRWLFVVLRKLRASAVSGAGRGRQY